MSQQEAWFQDLLSKVKPEDFDSSGAPNLMDVWVENEGERIAHWVRTVFKPPMHPPIFFLNVHKLLGVNLRRQSS